jgi:hypothetical protein
MTTQAAKPFPSRGLRNQARRAGWFFSAVMAGLLVALSACSADDKVSTNYMVVNHTNVWVLDVMVNDRGGILGASPLGQSGRACCVTVPKKWRPDLQVIIGWQDDSTKQIDSDGKPMKNDGRYVLIPGQKYSRTVPIQEYQPDKLGTLYIHILPDRSVTVTVSMLAPFHPDYLPKNPLQGPRQP